MARGYHRLSLRARHLARQLGKAKNITLQRLHVHELRHAVSRKHGFRGPKSKPKTGQPGLYKRLTRKAQGLLRRLRHSRSWQVQKQTITELEHEVDRGEQIAMARQNRREAAEQFLERTIARARRAGARSRAGWNRMKPALARAARKAGVSTREAFRRAGHGVAKGGHAIRVKAGQLRGRMRSQRPGKSSQRRPQPRHAPLRPIGRTHAPRPRPLRTPRPAPARPRARTRTP